MPKGQGAIQKATYYCKEKLQNRYHTREAHVDNNWNKAGSGSLGCQDPDS